MADYLFELISLGITAPSFSAVAVGLRLACFLALRGKNHLVDIALFPDQIPDLCGIGHLLFTFLLLGMWQVYHPVLFMSTYFL